METKNTEEYIRDLGNSALEREKQFIPRCISWEAPDPSVSRAYIRVDTNNIQMKKYLIDGKPNFYMVFVLPVDNPSFVYEISWFKEGFSKTHYEGETLLDSKTAEESVSEFDTIEKGSMGMELLFQKLFPADTRDSAVFLKKFSNERENETVAWTNKTKPRIHESEIEYVKFRLQNAVDPLQEWIAKQLGVESHIKVPRIALCASGGGLRAAIGTRFFVDQIKKEGFLPAISYMTTLSGSTWFMTDWLVNKQLLPVGIPWQVNNRDILGSSDFDSFKIGSVLAWHNYRASDLYETASWFIELWANVIGHGYLTIMDKVWDPNDTRFYKVEKSLKNNEEKSTYPWPIMTAVGESDQDWFEFTPSQIGRLSLGSKQWAYIEPSAFGCKITQDGKKVASPPGDELGQLMATWGSAVTLEIQDLDKYVGNFYGTIGKIFGFVTSKKYVCPPLEVHSWENSPNKIVLRDGGLGINVPFPPAVEPERGVEIIIALDLSSDCWENPAGTMDLFSQWVISKNHPNFHGKKVPRFTPKSEEEKAPLRKADIYDLGGVVVVYIPVAIQNASDLVSTYKMNHSPSAQKLIYDTVMEKWNSVKGKLAEFILEKYAE